MNADILNDLAARVEALEGADRLLSLRIICALDIRPAWLRNCTGHLWLDTVCPNPVVRWCDERMKQSSGNPSVEDGPEFTASIDAAMTLVPEGWAIEAISAWPESPDGADNKTAAQSSARLVGTSVKRFGKSMVWGHGSGDGRAEGNATVPALALTAACLRAIAEMGKDNG